MPNELFSFMVVVNGTWLNTGWKTGSQKSGTWGTCALIRECERRRMRVCKLCKPDLTLVHAIGCVGMFCSWAPASWAVFSAVAVLWFQLDVECCSWTLMPWMQVERDPAGDYCNCSLLLQPCFSDRRNGRISRYGRVKQRDKWARRQEECKVKVEWRGWGTRRKDKDLCRQSFHQRRQSLMMHCQELLESTDSRSDWQLGKQNLWGSLIRFPPAPVAVQKAGDRRCSAPGWCLSSKQILYGSGCHLPRRYPKASASFNSVYQMRWLPDFRGFGALLSHS